MSATEATPQGVLLAMIRRLKDAGINASTKGVREATALGLEADKLIRPLLNLPDDQLYTGLDSVARGLRFALTRIVDEAWRGWFAELIESTIMFVRRLIGPLLSP
jgi:hypothetical protein